MNIRNLENITKKIKINLDLSNLQEMEFVFEVRDYQNQYLFNLVCVYDLNVYFKKNFDETLKKLLDYSLLKKIDYLQFYV